MQKMIRKIFDLRGAPILAGVFLTLYVAETFSALRKRTQPRPKRAVTNGLLAISGFMALRLILLPSMVGVAARNQHWRFSINPVSSSRNALRELVGFLFLDYSNYLWHILNHRVPFLWRFHVVHHIDADLDVTTAIRFHAGEMFTSVFYRSLAVMLSGVKPFTVLLYEVFFEGATQFHHSNWRLPAHMETILNKLIVTPRMHGVHHSMEKHERDSNFSVIFSAWDRLHKTFDLRRRQDEITIGVPEFPDPTTSVMELMTLPLEKRAAIMQ